MEKKKERKGMEFALIHARHSAERIIGKNGLRIGTAAMRYIIECVIHHFKNGVGRHHDIGALCILERFLHHDMRQRIHSFFSSHMEPVDQAVRHFPCILLNRMGNGAVAVQEMFDKVFFKGIHIRFLIEDDRIGFWRERSLGMRHRIPFCRFFQFFLGENFRLLLIGFGFLRLSKPWWKNLRLLIRIELLFLMRFALGERHLLYNVFP